MNIGSQTMERLNNTERIFYESMMRKVRGEIVSAYAKHFGVSASTFHFRMNNKPYSPADKKFFKDYAASMGLDIEQIAAEYQAGLAGEETVKAS